MPLGEFELIGRYFAAATCARPGPGVALGIGDDCALLQVPAGEQLAVSVDSLVAGVHFPEAADPFLLGQRALGVTVSDLAAMGAMPLGFTLALTLPDVQTDWLEGFARGLDLKAQQLGICLIGGNTARGPLNLGLTVFGRVPVGQALTRAGARVGDLLCVSGWLGDGAGALALLLGERQANAEIAQPLLDHYWSPLPQLALGQALRGQATAALDISDGLLADCGHIASASKVALVLELERLPLSAALRGLMGEEQARQCALSGGDDYQLAFTVPAAQLESLQAAGWPLHVVGRVEAGEGVRVLDGEGRPLELSRRGYEHFGVDND